MNILLKIRFAFLLFTCHGICYAQNNPLKTTQKILVSLDACRTYDAKEIHYMNTQARKALGLLPRIDSYNETLIFEFNYYLAYNYYKLSKRDSAQYFFDQTNTLLHNRPGITHKKPSAVANFLNLQGAFYAEKCYNDNKAILYYTQALQIAEQYQCKKDENNYLNNLGNVYDWLGNYEKAYQYYKKLNLRKNWSVNFASSLGWNALRRKQYKEAARYFALQLAHAQTSMYKEEEESLAYFSLGVCYSKWRQIAKSEYFLTRCLNYYQQQHITKHLRVSYVFLYKAQNAAMMGSLGQAMAYVQQGICANVLNFNSPDWHRNPSVSDANLSNECLFELLTQKADILSQLAQQQPRQHTLNLAVHTYALSIALAEKHRKMLDFQADKLAFNQQRREAFSKAITVGYTWYRQQPSIYKANVLIRILESSKAIALNDKIVSSQRTIPEKALKLNDTIITKSQEVAFIQQQLAQKKLRPYTRDSLNRLWNASSLQLSQYQERLEHLLLYRSQEVSTSNITLKEIVANIPTEAAYVSYIISPDNEVYVWALTKTSVSIQKLAIPQAELTQTLPAFIQMIRKHPGLRAYQGAKVSQELYNYLISPIESLLGDTKRLIICRDGILNYLPFEVLETGKTPEDYLIHHYGFSYQYTTLGYLLHRGQGTVTKPSILDVSPFSQAMPLAQKKQFPVLHAAISFRNSSKLQGNQANKQAFLAQFSHFDILHLQCHSVVDTTGEGNSYLYFYPTGSNNKLGYHEIMNLPLNRCTLLLLPTCNSANGQFVKNETVQSLCYAFYHAGCKAILAAQWQAQDRASSVVTTNFYTYLRAGKSKDLALQQAKLTFLASEKDLIHPYFWANLCLIGNEESIESDLNSAVLLLLFTLILGTALMIWLRMKPTKAATTI